MNATKGIGAIFGGMLLMVIGLILSATVVTTSVTATGTTGIDSFVGTVQVTRLAPLIFVSVIIGSGVALIGAALAGFIGYGPMKG